MKTLTPTPLYGSNSKIVYKPDLKNDQLIVYTCKPISNKILNSCICVVACYMAIYICKTSINMAGCLYKSP